MATSAPEALEKQLEALDRFTSLMVERSAPLRFGTAETPEEREAAYRLRGRALIERGNASPSDFPDGLEFDAFDAHGVQVLGWDESGEVVATARIVLPYGGPLPIESTFDITIVPHGQVIDAGRFVVAHHLASRENRYFVGLLSFSWLVARKHGYHLVCGVASPGMVRHYRRLGFSVTELAPPKVYYGEERVPCWIDVVGSGSRLESLWS
ncbi:MAG: acyl-homoserine-lactone synthase [Anaerolineae bacterium]